MSPGLDAEMQGLFQNGVPFLSVPPQMGLKESQDRIKHQSLQMQFYSNKKNYSAQVNSPAGLNSEKKVPTFLPSTMSVMTWPVTLGLVPFAITTEVPSCKAQRAALTCSQAEIKKKYILYKIYLILILSPIKRTIFYCVQYDMQALSYLKTPSESWVIPTRYM